MTKIVFDSNKLELTIDGHADYAEKGKDIVCSAVSILFYTLAKAIDDTPFALSTDKEVKDASIKLTVHPKAQYVANIQLMFWQTMTGFELLANDYPDNVRIDIL